MCEIPLFIYDIKKLQSFYNFAVDFTQFISLLTHHVKGDKLDLCENVFVSGEHRYLLFRQFKVILLFLTQILCRKFSNKQKIFVSSILTIFHLKYSRKNSFLHILEKLSDKLSVILDS